MFEEEHDPYFQAEALEAALAAKEAELAASRRVIYLLQWSGARFHDAIRAIQRDCSPEIAARIDRALADNAAPPEAVDPELAAERAKVEKLREDLREMRLYHGGLDTFLVYADQSTNEPKARGFIKQARHALDKLEGLVMAALTETQP